MNSFKLHFITLLIGCFLSISCEKQPVSMVITSSDTLVQKFYKANQKEHFWFSSNRNSRKAAEWLTEIEAASRYGIASDQLQIDQFRSTLSKRGWIDNLLKEYTDQQITELVLHYLKELQEGNIRFDYDEVRIPRDSVYITQLLNAKWKGSVAKMVARLDCKDRDYLVLKKYMNDSITPNDSLKYKSVIRAMNYRRYLTVNHKQEYILVNIPAAEAFYFKNDIPVLAMKTVPGKKSKPTPTIASYITSIDTFPSWNVPHQIAVNELLPKIQQDENYLEQHNIEVVNAKGDVIEYAELNWKVYNAKNFPHFFRQSTGPANSLGVIKFNLQNPFNIFLHATSNQTAFNKDYRFLSHGCIRLEKPVELANAILRNDLDVQKLDEGKKDPESNTIMLPKKVTTFIIYSPATVVNNNVTFFPDVYGQIK